MWTIIPLLVSNCLIGCVGMSCQNSMKFEHDSLIHGSLHWSISYRPGHTIRTGILYQHLVYLAISCRTAYQYCNRVVLVWGLVPRLQILVSPLDI